MSTCFKHSPPLAGSNTLKVVFPSPMQSALFSCVLSAAVKHVSLYTRLLLLQTPFIHLYIQYFFHSAAAADRGERISLGRSNIAHLVVRCRYYYYCSGKKMEMQQLLRISSLLQPFFSVSFWQPLPFPAYHHFGPCCSFAMSLKCSLGKERETHTRFIVSRQ